MDRAECFSKYYNCEDDRCPYYFNGCKDQASNQVGYIDSSGNIIKLEVK